jgi:outer membrane protein assembly factor BamA
LLPKLVVFLRLVCLIVFSGIAIPCIGQNNPLADSLTTLTYSKPDTLGATSCDSLTIRTVLIAGNVRTRSQIIIRELAFREGSKVALTDTGTMVRNSANLIFNTRLFIYTIVDLLPLAPPGTCPMPVLVQVIVKERWYFFPFPIIDLADRSINEWIYNRGASLSRLVFGLQADVYNVRGRNETLRLMGQIGFVQKFQASYSIPYLTRRQREGLNLEALYYNYRQAAIFSDGNRQFFYSPSSGVGIERWLAQTTFSLRNGFYSYQNITAGFARWYASDSILSRSPKYFNNGSRFQRYALLRYSFTHDRRDIRQYPLRGYYGQLNLEQLGIFPSDEVHISTAKIEIAKYTPLAGRFFIANGAQFTASIPMNQPYNLTRGQGFGQSFVRGYEKYVLEGAVHGVLKNTLRYLLFSRTYRIPYMPLSQFEVLPISIYLKGYADLGYVRNPSVPQSNARLINRWLGGTGAGVDIVTSYDYVLRLEYSINRQYERGFFIHITTEL